MGGTTIGTRALRAFERRAATQRRAAEARRDGSSGPASACRVIDPANGAVLGEYRPHRFEPPAARLCLTDFRRRWNAAQRQANKRARDAMNRKLITIAPPHPELCEALRAFARVSENSGDKVAKAVRAILFNVEGWEDDEELLTAIGTAIVEEWIGRWL